MSAVLQASAASPNLWDLAVRTLDEDLRQLVDFGHLDSLQALQEVARLAEEKKDQSVRRRLKIHRKNGENIILRDIYEKISRYVHKFKEIGDIAVQYDPAHASLPWAGARLLLQLVINETQAFSFMLEGLCLVTNLITRYAIVEELYLRDYTHATKQLSDSLVKLYAMVLTFLGKTHYFFSSNTAKRMLKSTFTLTENGLQQIVQEIEQAEVQVDRNSLLVLAERQTNVAGGVLETNNKALDISQNLDALSSKLLSDNATTQRQMEVLLQMRSELHGPVHRIASQLSEIKDSLDASQRANILSWLSNIPYEQHHQNSRKGRLRDSGTWLLRKSEYLNWRSSSFSSILWLHGIPGSGKTTLVSFVIDELSQEIVRGQNLPPVAYFYCARDTAEPQRSNPEDVLLSLARQLSGIDHTLPIRTPTIKKYSASTSFPKRKPTLEEAVDLIISLTDENPATIIVDALDECDAFYRYRLLEALDTIIQQSSNIVKVFVSSREDSDIVCKLEDSPNLYLHADDNKKDIENFIRFEVEEAILKQRLLNGNVSSRLRQLIMETLNRDAQGMFRWVSLQLQNLCDPRRMKVEADVLRELGKLPKSLSDLYAVIFEQIQASGKQSKEIAERILKWLTVAQQPLNVELAIAAASGGNSNAYAPLGSRDLLSITCNLIVIDKGQDVTESENDAAESENDAAESLNDAKRQDVIRFAHLSVREYFESRTDFNEEEAHMHVAMTCLEEYANLETPFRIHTLSDALKASAADRASTLRSYSKSSWPYHVGMVHCEALRLPLLALLRRCLFRSINGSCSFKEWRNQVSSLSPHLPFKVRRDIWAATTPFLAVCIFGLSEILAIYDNAAMLICMQRLVPDVRSEFSGMNGLHLTTNQGFYWCTKEILKRGFDVNTPTANGETSLHIAVRGKHIHMLQLLVEYGADTNALSTAPPTQGFLSRPLDRFIGRRPERMVRSSLGFRTGTGISSAIDEAAEAPIHHAAFHGFDEGVSELIRLGADVNLRDSLGATPLIKALEGWHGGIIQELLDAKADINIPLLYGRTPLHLAAASGQFETASLLLRYGANPHLQDFLGSSSIQIARRYNHNELAEMLEAVQLDGQANSVPQQPAILYLTAEDRSDDDDRAESGVEFSNSKPVNLAIPKIAFSEWDSLVAKQKPKPENQSSAFRSPRKGLFSTEASLRRRASDFLGRFRHRAASDEGPQRLEPQHNI